MLLLDLMEQILPEYTPSGQKDLKTAVRYLAQALGAADASRCSLDSSNRPLPELCRALKAHLRAEGKGHATIRNVNNHVRRMFRLAEAKSLFKLIPSTPPERLVKGHRPRRPGSPVMHDGTNLPMRYWPRPTQMAFSAFTKWATDPVVEGRDAKWQKRPITVQAYRQGFEQYFGYLYHQRHLTKVSFKHLFELTLIRDFIHWHVNERHHRPTRTIQHFLRCLIAFTGQYHPMPELRRQLLDLKRSLPQAAPVYNKSDAWVPCAELRRIGEAIWPQHLPQLRPSWYKARCCAGLTDATRAGKSLMLQLWTYIPYRQRNIREMELHRNLYKDNGTWRIRFVGEQLKIARKRGRPNHFDLAFPPQLVQTLEEYLAIWRPIIAEITEDRFQHVFLTRWGTPFTASGLWYAMTRLVYSYTKKHWHPHIIRTTWTTEWLHDIRPGDFHTAAIMLNDSYFTVINNYAHLLDDNAAENAYQLIHTYEHNSDDTVRRLLTQLERLGYHVTLQNSKVTG
jgi:hypothetical protein